VRHRETEPAADRRTNPLPLHRKHHCPVRAMGRDGRRGRRVDACPRRLPKVRPAAPRERGGRGASPPPKALRNALPVETADVPLNLREAGLADRSVEVLRTDPAAATDGRDSDDADRRKVGTMDDVGNEVAWTKWEAGMEPS